MNHRLVLLLAVAFVTTAQQGPPDRRFPADTTEEVRAPDVKVQRELLKADYQKTLEDARELSRLASELKADLEKNDYNVLSVATLKKTDSIDRLAKRIHDRLKRF